MSRRPRTRYLVTDGFACSFFNNPVARDFVGAQQSIHKMQETVTQYVAKTYELGRIPTPEDFDSGSCGPSCGCGH